MKDQIFREYDIRGKVPSELSVDEVYKLTKAVLYFFKEQNPNLKSIAVGNDGRIHSPQIKEEMCRAIQDSGCDVFYIGMCTSPILYYTMHNFPVDAGLMITASHNGPEYNGIKICLGKENVWGKDIQVIKNYYKAGKALAADKQGSFQEHNVIDSYVAYLKNQFSDLVGDPIKAIVDCGNGAAGTVLPQLIKAMEWPNVDLLFAEVDGTYPNHQADPIVEENMQDVKRVLQTTDKEVGLGLDGDCDRMTPMTKEGELVSGDKLLALFAQPIAQSTQDIAVVFDIKCSAGLPELLTQWHAKPIISPSGHSIIKQAMKKHKAVLAGELSCHFFFGDRYFGYDDGVYAMMRLFELIKQSGKSLGELVKVFPKKYSTSEFRIESAQEKLPDMVREIKEKLMTRKGGELLTIDGVRLTTEDGWGMLRASNTQPVLCVRFEGNSPEGLCRLRDEFVELMKPYYDAAFLEKTFAL
jgi:phosphomannomutase/phosphoglucomutase